MDPGLAKFQRLEGIYSSMAGLQESIGREAEIGKGTDRVHSDF